jgi:DcuC family C4-dicarboxylate transporter
MVLALGIGVIALAIVATARRLDVRLVLTLAALVLGAIAGARDMLQQSDTADALRAFAAGPMQIARTFLSTLVAEKFVVPICCAMGFAHVLRLTECDKHLIQLLIQPLRRMRPLLIPGGVIVGFLINIPVISQTSTAVCLGAVLIPLLRAAGISPVTSAAVVLLGASIGGELLNPGAPEINTIANAMQRSHDDLPPGAPEGDTSAAQAGDESYVVNQIAPLNFLNLGVATTLFWFLSMRYEARWRAERKEPEASVEAAPEFRVNLLKAIIPLAPVIILFLVGQPHEVIKVPRSWLVGPKDDPSCFGSRLVGAAMVAGAVLAVLSTPSSARYAAKAFFEGAGYAFSTIIAVIVAATCFGKGVELIGLAQVIGNAIGQERATLIPGAGGLTMAFAFLSGSGMAATQSLFGFFVEPANAVGVSLPRIGGVIALGAAAGRTMSPVATVTLMCAAMTESDAIAVVRRVMVPLLVSMSVVTAVAVWMVASP